MKIHAREVEQMFREKGPERASMEILAIIIEHMHVQNQQINECVNTIVKCIDMIGATASGYANIRKQVETIKGKKHEDDLPEGI